ncbi:MAG: Biopolymer transport protein ExbD [Pseudomonadota bacterium]|jgi:biopolymer transport protein ExbD
MGMNMNNAGGSGDPEVMMDINTTPLIDVMLVLLIMLIITIPVQLHSVNLDMPINKPNVKPPVEPVVVKLDIDERSSVFWNGAVVQDRQALENFMKTAASTEPQPEVHFRPNKDARYDIVAGVLASAQRLGLKKIGIIGSEQFVND